MLHREEAISCLSPLCNSASSRRRNWLLLHPRAPGRAWASDSGTRRLPRTEDKSGGHPAARRGGRQGLRKGCGVFRPGVGV